MVGTLFEAVTARLQASKKVGTEALCEELLLPRWGDASWGVTLDKWCGKGPTEERNRTIATGQDGPPLEHELAATWLVYHDDRKMARKCAKRYVPASCGSHYNDRHVSQLLEATYDMGERKDGDGGEAVRMMAKHLGFNSSMHEAMVTDLAERIDAPIDPVIAGVALQVLVSAGQAEGRERKQMVNALLWQTWGKDKMNMESALAFLCLYRLKHELTDYLEFKRAIDYIAPSSQYDAERECISGALEAAKAQWVANGCIHDSESYEQTQRVLLAGKGRKKKKQKQASAPDSD
jgi:hypothetical protein